jgi:uncharacterized repeat protein (TIGR01451 family)
MIARPSPPLSLLSKYNHKGVLRMRSKLQKPKRWWRNWVPSIPEWGKKKMNKNQRLCALRTVAFTIILLTWISDAYSDTVPFFKPDLPDFYQHQKSGPFVNVEMDRDMDFSKTPAGRPGTVPDYDLTTEWWEKGFGWCCVAAFVNSFYYLEKHFGYDGLFTRTGGEEKTWQEQMVFAIEDFAINLFPSEGGTLDVPQYVRKLESESRMKIQDRGGQAPPPLSYAEFFRDGTGKVMKQEFDENGNPLPVEDVSERFESLFDVYHAELCHSEDVTVRFKDFGVLGPDVWWSGLNSFFHVVTGAGVEDCDNKAIKTFYFADPDKRNEFKDGAYTDNDVRQPYPAGEEVPLPIGQKHYEKVTVDANDEIIDGLYVVEDNSAPGGNDDGICDPGETCRGARIVRITAISPIEADLSIHITDSPDPVRRVGELTYRLRISNHGRLDATGVIVTDSLPENVNFVSASSGCSPSGRTVTCNIGNMRRGETAVRLIRVRPTAPGVLRNTATVTANETDPRPGNNTATTVTTVR